MAFNGQNIKFLQGSYEALSKLTSSEVGAFYVTNDTHEMFLGVDAEKAPVALNRWVDVRDNWAAINNPASDYREHPGKLYYAKAENILCTWNGEKWVQINPDTDTNTSLSKVDITKGQVVEENGAKSVKYTLTFTQKDKEGQELTDEVRTAELIITDELVTSLSVDVHVGLEASVADGVATVGIVGTGSDTSKTVAITGNQGVSVENKDGKISIEGTTYSIGSDGAEIVLTDSATAKTKVKIVGDTWIEAGASGSDNEIKISHKAPTGDGSDVAIKKSNTASISATDRKFSAVTGVKADANGHVVGTEVTEFEIPNTVYTLKDVYGKVNETEYSTGVQLVNGSSEVVSTANLKTAHVITVDGVETVVSNGGNLGSFYSAAEIDRQFRVLDALTYKGTVNNRDALPVEEVSLGDTYKVNTAFGDFQVGDLLIANGVEGTDGYISGTITWDHVATGADADTTYVFEGNADQIKLYNNVTKETKAITVIDDSYITATVANDTFSITHNNISRTNSTGEAINPAHGASFDVITGVTSDPAGHVIDVETSTVTLPGEDQVIVVADDRKLTIKNAAGDVKGSIAVDAGSKLDAVGVVTDDKELVVTVSHEAIATVTSADTSKDEDIALDGEHSFVVVDSLIDDGFGHITNVKTKTIKIAKETTYELTAPTLSDNVVTQELKDNAGQKTGSIKLASDSLTYKVEDGTTKIDLMWGSF